MIRAGLNERVHTLYERLDDVFGVRRGALPLGVHISPNTNEPGKLNSLESRRSEDSGQATFPSSPPKLHLPQTILSRDKTLCEKQVILSLCKDVRDAPRISNHFNGF